MTDSEALEIAERLLRDAVRAMDLMAQANHPGPVKPDAIIAFHGWNIDASRAFLARRAIERMKHASL